MKVQTTKTDKAEVKVTDFRLWCEACCIRIAPHEDRTLAGDKAYHPRCYSKVLSTMPTAEV